MYTAVFKSIAVTAQQDFFEVLAGTNKPIKVHAWSISQSTEVGDAQEEGLVLTCNRGVGSTTGSGGTVPTAAPLGVDDTACGATIEVNNTTKMTAGTITELEDHVWNVRVPYMMIYTPETRPYIKAGDRWTLELETTPADSITVSGTIWFEEVS
jgi:hypothetical protein